MRACSDILVEHPPLSSSAAHWICSGHARVILVDREELGCMQLIVLSSVWAALQLLTQCGPVLCC